MRSKRSRKSSGRQSGRSSTAGQSTSGPMYAVIDTVAERDIVINVGGARAVTMWGCGPPSGRGARGACGAVANPDPDLRLASDHVQRRHGLDLEDVEYQGRLVAWHMYVSCDRAAVRSVASRLSRVGCEGSCSGGPEDLSALVATASTAICACRACVELGVDVVTPRTRGHPTRPLSHSDTQPKSRQHPHTRTHIHSCSHTRNHTTRPRQQPQPQSHPQHHNAATPTSAPAPIPALTPTPATALSAHLQPWRTHSSCSGHQCRAPRMRPRRCRPVASSGCPMTAH